MTKWRRHRPLTDESSAEVGASQPSASTRQTGSVTIAEVDVEDVHAFHDWYSVVEEAWVDAWPGDPLWAGEAEMRTIFSDHEYNARTLLLGHTDEGEPAGAAEVGLPTKDNLSVANVEVSVRPALRGRGIGRRLLERAEELAAAGERSVLQGSTFGRSATLASREARFAMAAGFSHARTEVRRELRLPLQASRMEALERENAGRATDFELVSWSRHCPDELVESLGRLLTTLTADEPHGELEVEAQSYDVERTRRWEGDLEHAGRELICTAAVSKETGELAAVTEIGMPRPGEDLAMQFATVVAPEHRGHRLGVLVKLANLRLSARRELAPRRICTWNAEANEHMIRVNDELGFEIVGMAFNWQKAAV
jgi:GNAT superfamily N-acetyltransferase